MFKNRKGRRDPVVGAGSAGGRGARCALQHLPLASASPGGCAEAAGERIRRRLGHEAAEPRSGLADCPRSGPWGMSPPARWPARAAPLCEGDDVTELCRALPPAPGSPPSAPAAEPSAGDRWGRPENRGGGTLASARTPHFGGVGWGCRLRRAPSPSGRSSGAVRQLPPARGELRGPP